MGGLTKASDNTTDQSGDVSTTSETVPENQESQRFAGLGFSTAKVIEDTETGVQYLYVSFGRGGGVTVLVDQDGKPLLEGEEQ